MRITARSSNDPGGSVFRHAVNLLIAVFLVACLHATMPAGADETGIRGTVLRGPVHGGPVVAGQSHEAPFQASFSVLGAGRTVARFESDEDGYFEVLLSPGDYTIVPDKSAPILFPQRQGKAVTVPEDGFARITLRFDTGMR